MACSTAKLVVACHLDPLSSKRIARLELNFRTNSPVRLRNVASCEECACLISAEPRVYPSYFSAFGMLELPIHGRLCAAPGLRHPASGGSQCFLRDRGIRPGVGAPDLQCATHLRLLARR